MTLGVLEMPVGRYRPTLHVVGRFTGELPAGAFDEAEEEAMYLGGSRDTISQGQRADGTYRLRDSMRIEIDHDAIPSGWRWVLQVEGRVESGVTCTPQLYNVTDDATTAGSALTTGETRQDIVVPSASGVKVYEGRVALSGATEKDAWVTMQAIREQV